MLGIIGSFGVIGKERIVSSCTGHAGEVKSAAAARTERHGIVERAPFELVRGHDVPAPPATVVKLRLVEHLHSCDDDRTVHRIEPVRGALARRRNDRRIHEQAHNTGFRGAKSHQDVRRTLRSRRIVHVAKLDRITEIDPQIVVIKGLRNRAEISGSHTVGRNLHLEHRIRLRILPRERKKRDAVEEERTHGHRIFFVAAHRLEHHKAIFHLHMHHHETAAARATAKNPVLCVVVSGGYRVNVRTAATAATSKHHTILTGALIVGIFELRIQSALTAGPFAAHAGCQRTFAPFRLVRIGIDAGTTAAATAEPSVIVAEKLADCVTHLGFPESGKREAVAAIAAICTGNAVHTVGSGPYHRLAVAFGGVDAVGRPNAAQTAATTAAGSAAIGRTAKTRRIDCASCGTGRIRASRTATSTGTGSRASTLIVPVAEPAAAIATVPLILLGLGRLERILQVHVRIHRG